MIDRIVIDRWYRQDCTLATLTFKSFQCFVLELPWKNNRVNVSCIPEGVYKAKKRMSPGKGYLVIEYLNIPNRTFIQIHRGAFTRHSQGCQLVGKGISFIDGDTIPDVYKSEETLNELLKLLPYTFEIEIRGGLNHEENSNNRTL